MNNEDTLNYDRELYEQKFINKNPKVNFETQGYSFQSIAGLIRHLSDAYSLCNSEAKRDIREYAVAQTKGKCLLTGKTIFERDVNGIYHPVVDFHEDHIYPASKGGIYELGNIALVDSDANLEKSDLHPIDYIKYRMDSGLSTLFETIEEYEEFFYSFTKPFRLKHKEIYDVATSTDEVDKAILVNLFIPHIDFNKSTKFTVIYDWGPENNLFWEKYRDIESEIHNKYSGTSIQKRRQSAKIVAEELACFIGKEPITNFEEDYLSECFDKIAISINYEYSIMPFVRGVMKDAANELGFNWTFNRKRSIDLLNEELYMKYRNKDNSVYSNYKKGVISGRVSQVDTLFNKIKELDINEPIVNMGEDHLRQLFNELSVNCEEFSEYKLKHLRGLMTLIAEEDLDFKWPLISHNYELNKIKTQLD